MLRESAPVPSKLSTQPNQLVSADSLKSTALNSSSETKIVNSSPKDRWKLNYYIFLIVGFSSLFQWHIFIKNSFFWERFSSTPFATTFSNWIARVYMVTNLIAMLALILLPDRYKGSSSLRVTFSFIGNVSVFVAMTILPLCEWISGITYFYITLVLAGLCGFFGGVLQNSLFGMASKFPSNYIQAIMAGQGLAGMVSSVLLMVANIVAGDIEKSPYQLAVDASIYFGLSLFLLVIGLVLFLYVQRLSFFKHYYNISSDPKHHESQSDEMLTSRATGGISSIFTKLPSALFPIAVFFVLFITLSAFPFIFSNITSSSSSNSFFVRKLFTSTGYLLFDVGDYIGKSLPGMKACYINNSVFILASSFLRIIFLPLFMLCNFRDHPDFNGALRLFSSDAIFFILALLFGLTNGYSCSLLFMKAPQTIPQHLQEKMGTIMALFLSIGLALGPFFAGVIGFFLK